MFIDRHRRGMLRRQWSRRAEFDFDRCPRSKTSFPLLFSSFLPPSRGALLRLLAPAVATLMAKKRERRNHYGEMSRCTASRPKLGQNRRLCRQIFRFHGFQAEILPKRASVANLLLSMAGMRKFRQTDSAKKLQNARARNAKKRIFGLSPGHVFHETCLLRKVGRVKEKMTDRLWKKVGSLGWKSCLRYLLSILLQILVAWMLALLMDGRLLTTCHDLISRPTYVFLQSTNSGTDLRSASRTCPS